AKCLLLDWLLPICCCSLYPQLIVPFIIIYRSALVLIPRLRSSPSCFCQGCRRLDLHSRLNRSLRLCCRSVQARLSRSRLWPRSRVSPLAEIEAPAADSLP